MRLPGISPPTLGLRRIRTDPGTWLSNKLSTETGTIGLLWTLNQVVGLEERRKLIADALSRCRKVYAVARACDSGVELIEVLVKHGVTPELAAPGNLSSNEIASLRPSSAMFVEGVATYKAPQHYTDASRARMYAFVQHVRKASNTLESLPFELPSLSTKLLDVGLSWEHA